MRSFVLLTALPPTRGHLNLVRFAASMASSAEVLVVTQPSEPLAYQRVQALRDATVNLNVNIHHLHKELPQEPEVAVGFWDMWLGFLGMYGMRFDDIIVASEMYGKKLAEMAGVRFMPYDIERSILYTKATDVRRNLRMEFAQLLPEFQPYVRKTVTLFGAESTGKTTLSRYLARECNGHWLFEYARPYLEAVGPELTWQGMEEIWLGQKALQDHAHDFVDKPFIFQDTDLMTTVGYWDFWRPGTTPSGLIMDAEARQSDLYLLTRSNIPFEVDPLRYGGDKRESDDQYWIDLCERYSLNYRVLESANPADRRSEAKVHIDELFANNSLQYERVGNG